MPAFTRSAIVQRPVRAWPSGVIGTPISLWRRRWYLAGDRQARLARPVISVGNISAGGRGKTPVVAAIAAHLVAAGERPAILSRGYARRRAEEGVVVVSDGRRLLSDVERSGDEPMLLARAVPGAGVFVSAQRAVAGVLAERACGCTVHVLDDGFQHLQLARAIDIVIIAARDLDDRAFPLGKLRESVDALQFADAIVVDDDAGGSSGVVARLRARGVTAPVFALRREACAPVALEPERPMPPAGAAVLAVSGIADPARFARTLETTGWRVADSMVFRDHHWFSQRDIAEIAVRASRAGAAGIVTTTKDAMRLLVHRPLPLPSAHVPIEAKLARLHADVASADDGAFHTWLDARLAEAAR